MPTKYYLDAYQIWLKQGNVGSQKNFLATLKGDKGDQGEPGISAEPKGEYDGGTDYVVGDLVSYNGSSYLCLQDSTGNLPTNTNYWLISAAQGIQGPAGLNWQGAWSGGSAYVIDDVVQHDGSAYACILGHTNQAPPNATYWEVLAAKGDTGETGPGSGDMLASIYDTNSDGKVNAADSADTLSGLNASIAELNYSQGVTDNIQVQLDNKSSSTHHHDTNYATIAHMSAIDNPHSVTAAQVGLGNVDNTADIDKPVSSATQTALDGKADFAHISNTNNPHAVVANQVNILDAGSLYTATQVEAALTEVMNKLNLRPNKNLLINGNFDVWQRATSQTANAYGSDDRWRSASSGTTKIHSQQEFTLGQTDVPNNPKYFSRTVVSSVGGASNYCLKSQKIESVRNLAGANATLSFWAKADASKNIAIELVQGFGTGGSPSTIIDGIGSQKIALTTSWAKYIVTIAIPNISGKTLGTDNNDYLQLLFWFDAGSDYNSRTDTLGQQSGTFDIAQVKIEECSTATDYVPKTYAEELRDCQRYYWQGESVSSAGNFYSSLGSYKYAGSVEFPITMRKTPTVGIITDPTYTDCNSLSFLARENGFVLRVTNSATQYRAAFGLYSADAEL